MALWDILKTTVSDYVKNNSQEEITGDGLQAVLHDMVDELGEFGTFKDVAVPATVPGTINKPVFFLAGTEGTYTNFNNASLASGELAILTNATGTWIKKTIATFTLNAPLADYVLKATYNELVANLLRKDNTVKYIPSTDYEPATSKYVIDIVSQREESVFMAGVFTDKADILAKTSIGGVSYFAFGKPVDEGVYTSGETYYPGAVVDNGGTHYIQLSNEVSQNSWVAGEWLALTVNIEIFALGKIYTWNGSVFDAGKKYCYDGSIAMNKSTKTIWMYSATSADWVDTGTSGGNNWTDTDDIPEGAINFFIQAWQRTILLTFGNEWTFGASLVQVDNSLEVINLTALGNINAVDIEVSGYLDVGGASFNEDVHLHSDLYDYDNNPYPRATDIITRDTQIRYTGTVQSTTLDLDLYNAFFREPANNQQFTIQNAQIGDAFSIFLGASTGSLHATPFVFVGYTVYITDEGSSLASWSTVTDYILYVNVVMISGSNIYLDVRLKELVTQ